MEWPRIVVVPFENLSADPGLDAFAASMTEEIMLRLDRLDLFLGRGSRDGSRRRSRQLSGLHRRR